MISSAFLFDVMVFKKKNRKANHFPGEGLFSGPNKAEAYKEDNKPDRATMHPDCVTTWSETIKTRVSIV